MIVYINFIRKMITLELQLRASKRLYLNVYMSILQMNQNVYISKK